MERKPLTICEGCSAPMLDTGPPINDSYCSNDSCTYQRDRMFASIRARINAPDPKDAIIEGLVEAAKRLSFAAQTSGGTAGRDDELVAAIEQTKVALEAAGVKP